jgi:hypothetical protein
MSTLLAEEDVLDFVRLAQLKDKFWSYVAKTEKCCEVDASRGGA